MRYGWGVGGVLALAVLAGCAQAPTQDRTMTAGEAVEAASRVNQRGVRGKFVFEVRAVGTNGQDSFINSELDYRDPRSLNVRLSPRVRDQLEARLGGKLDQVLVGRRVLVTGKAARVRVDLSQGATPIGKFYYQTHVHITAADQLTLI